MRRWIFAILLMVLFIPATGYAQANLVIDRLQVDLWPEYDRAEVLVIYRLTLSNQVPLPVEITLRIPKASGSPYNLAMQDVDGLLYNLDYTTLTKGDFVLVTFTTPSVDVQMEYYDNDIQRNGSQRQFTYTWAGEYPVNTFVFKVQQPVNATQFSLDPSLGSGVTGDDSLTYFTSMRGSTAQGQSLTQVVQYQKPDDSLSASLQPVQPVEVLGSDTPGNSTFLQVLPWLLVALGVLAIAGGAFWYWQMRRTPTRQAVKRHRASQAHSDAGVYCHQCGKRASSADVFCRTCGTQLKLE
jgi:hypothetical protein